MTSVMVSPRSAAMVLAVCQMPSGMRMVRCGVLPVGVRPRRVMSLTVQTESLGEQP
mgnify:CR=1 FL=1